MSLQSDKCCVAFTDWAIAKAREPRENNKQKFYHEGLRRVTHISLLSEGRAYSASSS